MLCPRHPRALLTRKLYDIEVEVCPACHGVWFDWQELPRLLQRFSYPHLYNDDADFTRWEKIQTKFESGVTPPADFWREDDIECPKGHGTLHKHYFVGSTIGVDQCRLCKGFWLDGKELLAVRRLTDPSPVGQAYAKLFGTEGETSKNMEKGAEFVGQLVSLPLLPFFAPHQSLYIIGNLILNFFDDWYETVELSRQVRD